MSKKWGQLEAQQSWISSKEEILKVQKRPHVPKVEPAGEKIGLAGQRVLADSQGKKRAWIILNAVMDTLRKPGDL